MREQNAPSGGQPQPCAAGTPVAGGLAPMEWSKEVGQIGGGEARPATVAAAADRVLTLHDGALVAY